MLLAGTRMWNEHRTSTRELHFTLCRGYHGSPRSPLTDNAFSGCLMSRRLWQRTRWRRARRKQQLMRMPQLALAAAAVRNQLSSRLMATLAAVFWKQEAWAGTRHYMPPILCLPPVCLIWFLGSVSAPATFSDYVTHTTRSCMFSVSIVFRLLMAKYLTLLQHTTYILFTTFCAEFSLWLLYLREIST